MTLQQRKSRQVVLLDSDGSKKVFTPEAFSSVGIELHTVSTPKQALATLSSTAACVLVVDIQAFGVAHISALRKHLPDLAIIVMLGFNIGDLINDTQLGRLATTILTQPFTQEDVVLAVRNAFTQRSMSSADRSLQMDGETRRPRVMLAEDDRSVRLLLEAQLKKCGYDMTCAEDGAAALQIVESNDFDILVTDIMMPGMDGIELTRKVKTLKPRLPVIVFSAADDSKASLEALRAGGILLRRETGGYAGTLVVPEPRDAG